MAAATVAELKALQDLIATSLTRRIESGEATASDMANAIKLLRQCDIPIGRAHKVASLSSFHL